MNYFITILKVEDKNIYFRLQGEVELETDARRFFVEGYTSVNNNEIHIEKISKYSLVWQAEILNNLLMSERHIYKLVVNCAYGERKRK